jgi:beta-alanine degradation protein BauB
MHGHPASLAVFLTENRARFTFPGGKTEERSWTAGEIMFTPAEEHLPKNLTDKALELVLIELKSLPGTVGGLSSAYCHCPEAPPA